MSDTGDVEAENLLDDDTLRLLRRSGATPREREWMSAALRRAADRLDESANTEARELKGGTRRRGLAQGAEIRHQGRIDGLRSAATELRRWAEACVRP